MKKIISLLLVGVMIFSLSACGDSGKKSDEEKKKAFKATELVVGESHSVEEYADFSLFKIVTTKKVTGSMGDNIYYNNDADGEVYVDLILDLQNTSAENISTDELLELTAEGVNGTEYAAKLYAIETNEGTCVSAYEDITPLTTVRLHCAVSVPETETALQLLLKVENKKFSYDYTLGEMVRNAQTLTVGKEIMADDYAALTLKKVFYTEKLEPTDTSSFYTYYDVDNAENTYLVVNYALTNYQSTDKEADSFASVKARYMDKYEYDGFVVVEDSDKQGFNNFAGIGPLEKGNVFCLIEVPKTVVTNDVELTFVFHGQEYVYTYQAQ